MIHTHIHMYIIKVVYQWIDKITHKPSVTKHKSSVTKHKSSVTKHICGAKRKHYTVVWHNNITRRHRPLASYSRYHNVPEGCIIGYASTKPYTHHPSKGQDTATPVNKSKKKKKIWCKLERKITSWAKTTQRIRREREREEKSFIDKDPI